MSAWSLIESCFVNQTRFEMLNSKDIIFFLSEENSVRLMLVNICGVCPTRPGYLSYFIDIASYFQIVFLSLAASVSPEEFCFSTFVKMSLVCITESVWQSVDG